MTQLGAGESRKAERIECGHSTSDVRSNDNEHHRDEGKNRINSLIIACEEDDEKAIVMSVSSSLDLLSSEMKFLSENEDKLEGRDS
jgi:hypothetical protein